MLVGYKGYRSNSWRLTLFEYAGIELATPSRKNELLQYTIPNDYKRLRKRIEVIFYQLVEQFSIRKNYAKSQKVFSQRKSLKSLFIRFSNISIFKIICLFAGYAILYQAD